jgi:protein SYS1
MSGGQFYGRERFDPIGISSRIATLQLVFYAVFATTAFTLSTLVGVPWTVINILDASNGFSVDTALGWCDQIALFVAALASAASMPYIVQRAKKTPDFSFTLYFVHLVTSSTFSSFPGSSTWWVSHIAALLLTSTVGEQLCLRKEMQEISVDELLSRRRRREGGGGGGVGAIGGGSNGGGGILGLNGLLSSVNDASGKGNISASLSTSLSSSDSVSVNISGGPSNDLRETDKLLTQSNENSQSLRSSQGGGSVVVGGGGGSSLFSASSQRTLGFASTSSVPSTSAVEAGRKALPGSVFFASPSPRYNTSSRNPLPSPMEPLQQNNQQKVGKLTVSVSDSVSERVRAPPSPDSSTESPQSAASEVEVIQRLVSRRNLLGVENSTLSSASGDVGASPLLVKPPLTDETPRKGKLVPGNNSIMGNLGSIFGLQS